MSDVAKKARAAMKAKAQRLGSDRSTEKVDSSTFTPPELLNAQAKTGMRPISRRQFKKGGKVVGDATPQRADRVQRSGKKPLTADSFVNKNMKEANEERPGVKHIGGMAKGGSTYGVPPKLRLMKTHSEGGNTAKVYKNPDYNEYQVKYFKDGVHQKKADSFHDDSTDAHDSAQSALSRGYKAGGRTKREDGGSVADYDTGSRTGAGAVTKSRSKPTPPMPQRRPPPADYDTGSRTGDGAVTESRKAGGRTKKMDGGPMNPMGPAIAGASKMMAQSDRGVPSSTMSFGPVNKGKFARSAGLKKGGTAESHEDIAADKALIKKMVKPSARTGKDVGGFLRDAAEDAAKDETKTRMKSMLDSATGTGAESGMSRFKKGGRTGRATGGGIFSGASYPGKVPGAVPGGRTAHAKGGKTKGKTAINIVINAGKADDGSMMPPAPMGAPKGMPIPLPPAGAGMPPGAAPPMPMPPPGLMGAGGPPGAPPMPPGGMPPMGRKAGGRTYRSYKDMDAGSGSGLGRLEKTEIAARKGGIQRA